MALKQKDVMQYGVLGFIAALATPFLLQFISQIVSIIPGVSVDLQSISISTTGVGGVINTGLSSYAGKLFGAVPFLSGSEWIALGLGGAAFVIIGAFIVDAVKELQFAKSKVGRLATIFAVAGIATGWILSMSINIPAVSAVISLAVNAIVLAYILVGVNKALKLKLIP